MTVGEKLRVLRELEGRCRGLDRELSKADIVKLIRSELGQQISAAYLSQIETGRRAHMTNKTRLLLARFFRVHPGYLVDDPEGFSSHLTTPVELSSGGLTDWLRAGAVQFRDDPVVAEALAQLARAPERLEALRLLTHLLARPELVQRLLTTVESRTR